MEEFIGAIKMFAGSKAPQDWMFCHGQLLPINGNEPLFNVIGMQYGGGNGTFALPDLRGRVPVGVGHGGGMENEVVAGVKDGAEKFNLKSDQLPAHSHHLDIKLKATAGGTIEIPVHTTPGNEDTSNPGVGILANSGTLNYTSSPANGKYGGMPIPVKMEVTRIAGADCKIAGNSQDIKWVLPRLGIHFIICVEGHFPPRS
jgi:microcystin-dependent protein